MITETIAQIENRLIASLQANPVLYDPTNPDPNKRGLISTSQVSEWRSQLNVFATEIFEMQQVINIFEGEIEALLSAKETGTRLWWREQMLRFQYSASVPQIVNVVNFVAEYPIIDATLRIITRCAVKTTPPGMVVVLKLAKGTTGSLVPLSNSELIAAQAYGYAKQPAGIALSMISIDPDRVGVTATIVFDGQFVEATVKSAVIAALDNYLAQVSFSLSVGGVLVLIGNSISPGLIEHLMEVPGVVDVYGLLVRGRQFSVPYASATIVTQSYEFAAGYAIQEDDAGHTFTDTLTMELSVPA